GPWLVALQIDRNGHYPDVTAVLPRSPGCTILRLSDKNVASLSTSLEKRDVGGADPLLVTLELGTDSVAVVPAGPRGRSTRLRLAGSQFEGETMTTAIQAKYLLRALQMGLRELRADAPGGTVLFPDAHRLYLVACHLNPPAAFTARAPDPAAPAAS